MSIHKYIPSPGRDIESKHNNKVFIALIERRRKVFGSEILATNNVD